MPHPKDTITGIDEFPHIDFMSVLSAFDEGVIITDCKGTILFYNDVQAQIDDLSAELAVGRNVLDIYNLDESSSKIMRCIASGRPILGELFFYRTRRGKMANTITSTFPLKRGGRLVGTVCFVKDYNFLEKTVISSSGGQSRASSQQCDLDNGTRYRFTDIVGADDKILQAVKIARLAADSPSPVMLCGETGTGKELFAQAIHNYSSRGGRRFIGINCAAIPENLLEGLLFGTVRGAFTGAVDRAGIFEQAQSGTLFLDEVNSMPLNLQAKLLRALQEKKVRRVGASNDIDVDVKIISSVNTSPHRAIKQGCLRMDLYYRLGVVFINLPPLREQRNGLMILVQHFIYKNNLRMGKQVVNVAEDVLDVFREYQWPGNTRELEHIIEGAMNMIQGEQTLERHHLPAHFIAADTAGLETGDAHGHAGHSAATGGARRGDHRAAPAADSRPDDDAVNLRLAQRHRELALIEQTLSRTKGNISKAAGLLGISRQLLHYKMKKYGLTRQAFTSNLSLVE